MAVKTPIGTTEKINMPRIMMQGVSWGSMQCSNSIAKIGKRCEEERENLDTHKNLVKLPVPSMVDDMLAVSTCGHESLSTNTHINAQIELEKLRFHAPDAQGKTKCHNLHVAPEKKHVSGFESAWLKNAARGRRYLPRGSGPSRW